MGLQFLKSFWILSPTKLLSINYIKTWFYIFWEIFETSHSSESILIRNFMFSIEFVICGKIFYEKSLWSLKKKRNLQCLLHSIPPLRWWRQSHSRKRRKNHQSWLRRWCLGFSLGVLQHIYFWNAAKTKKMINWWWFAMHYWQLSSKGPFIC